MPSSRAVTVRLLLFLNSVCSMMSFSVSATCRPSEGSRPRARFGELDGRVVPRADVPGENVRRQVLGGQDAFAAVNHRPLNDVLQFADVARPRVVDQGIEHRVIDAADHDAVLLLEAGDEPLRERDDVDLPLAKRRDVELQHVEAVVKVGPEPALLDERLQFEVAGDDQPGLRAVGAVRTDRLELARLDHPQQLHLLLGAEDVDFVEQHRPATGREELAFLVGVGAGERAFDVAEQFAFDQLAGQGSAGDVQERLAALAPSSRGSGSTRYVLPEPVSPMSRIVTS